MILRGAKVALSPTSFSREDITIRYGRVAFASKSRTVRTSTLDLDGYLIFPGLINAHDHLEFNLFPRLGLGPYPNATRWAQEIYKPLEPPISTHLSVPKPVRLWWGGLKNLICGVTSVAHHNPYEPQVFTRGFPVRILKRFGWAHSLTFSPDVVKSFRSTPSRAPFIIHAGEGTDALSVLELQRLDEAHILRPSTVIVHGVAFGRRDLDLLRKKGASLIWCPTSNLFTLGRTLCKDLLNSEIPIALGSDSSLTSEGDLLDELPVAANNLPLSRIYNMVTQESARILRLHSGEGRIQDGGHADLVVVRDRKESPSESLLSFHPELVFLKGRLKLVSSTAADHLQMTNLPGFKPLEIQGRGKWFVEGNVCALIEATRKVLGDTFYLAGRRVVV